MFKRQSRRRRNIAKTSPEHPSVNWIKYTTETALLFVKATGSNSRLEFGQTWALRSEREMTLVFWLSHYTLTSHTILFPLFLCETADGGEIRWNVLARWKKKRTFRRRCFQDRNLLASFVASLQFVKFTYTLY